MAIHDKPSAQERLAAFFDELFSEIHGGSRDYGQFLVRIEEEFMRQGYRDENSGGVENILIVRLDAIGDMILTSGFLREVRENFPRARITLVCYSHVRPVVELCPYVNEVLSIDKNIAHAPFNAAFEGLAVFCRDNLWQKKFSIAFSPRWHDDTLYSLLLCWLSGARERIGYGSYPYDSWIGEPPQQIAAIDNFLLTKKIVTPKDIVRDVDKNFYLLLAADYNVNQTSLELFYSAADVQRAKELLEDIPAGCKKVILGIGSGETRKKYPVEKYLVALRELVKKNLAFIIVGGQNEIAEAEFLEKNLPRGKILNLVGKTTLREAEAITAQTDFYLGNDTGNLHMASAEKIPVLALYCEAQDRENILPGVFSYPHRFPPYQTNSVTLRPLHPLDECATLPPIYGWCHRNEPHCITQITPQEIVAAFEVLEGMI